MKRIKDALKYQLEKRGFFLQKATDKNEVMALIKSLYPMKIQTDLVRIGPKGDGGYLVPDDLQGIEACYSPGVDQMSEFELECLNIGMKIYMADKSVEKPNLSISEDQYSFIKKFVGCTNNEDFIAIDDWVKVTSTSETSDLLLQIDIEGGEYHSFIHMTDSLLKRFRIMVIEFHSLHELWNPHFFSMAKTVFDKILQTHICLHIHPNNCCGVDSRFGIDIPRIAEFTFVRKDRVKNKTFETSFPHKLDYDNTNNESIVLPKAWYKSV